MTDDTSRRKGTIGHDIDMAVVRTTLRNAVIPPAESCGKDCDCTAECERDWFPAATAEANSGPSGPAGYAEGVNQA